MAAGGAAVSRDKAETMARALFGSFPGAAPLIAVATCEWVEPEARTRAAAALACLDPLVPLPRVSAEWLSALLYHESERALRAWDFEAAELYRKAEEQRG